MLVCFGVIAIVCGATFVVCVECECCVLCLDWIGVVPQDTVLFNETIAYNIAYGAPCSHCGDVLTHRQHDQPTTAPTMDEIVGVAKKAQIHVRLLC